MSAKGILKSKHSVSVKIFKLNYILVHFAVVKNLNKNFPTLKKNSPKFRYLSTYKENLFLIKNSMAHRDISLTYQQFKIIKNTYDNINKIKYGKNNSSESKKALNMSKKQILKLVVLQIIILLPLF